MDTGELCKAVKMPTKSKAQPNERCFPYQQGNLDCLCGLYTAVNAIQISLNKPSRTFAEKLTNIGISYFDYKGVLSEVVTEGMSIGRQKWLTKHLIKQLPSLGEAELYIANLNITRNNSIALISEKTNQRTFVCVCLQGAISHFSIITDVTNSRVYLHDSDKLQWLNRKSFIEQKGKAPKYRVAPNSAYVLKRNDSSSKKEN